MNMLQVAVLGVAGVLLAVQFKGGKTEYSTYIALGVSVLIFTAVFGQLEVLVDTVREIGDIHRIRWSLYSHNVENDRNHICSRACFEYM